MTIFFLFLHKKMRSFMKRLPIPIIIPKEIQETKEVQETKETIQSVEYKRNEKENVENVENVETEYSWDDIVEKKKPCCVIL